MNLLPQHVADLERSGLSPAQREACGFYSITDPVEIADKLGWRRGGEVLGPCLAIPFRDRNGALNCYVRLKPDTPRKDKKTGNPIKYESPKGQPNRLFIPPGTVAALADQTKELIITEGEKKAAAADQHGFACVGITGVWSFQKGRKGNKNAPRQLIDDLAEIAWTARPVRIVLDSDAADKTDIRWAEFHLAELLTGAVVRIVRLPAGANGVKAGLDDFLLANGPEALRRLLSEGLPARRPVEIRTLTAFANFELVTVEDEHGVKEVAAGRHVTAIRDELLLTTGGWPKRIEGMLFAVGADGCPMWLTKADSLFSWISGRQARPVEWAYGQDMLSKPEFTCFLQQTAEKFAAIERLPHHPPYPTHFYLHPQIQGGDGAALRELLKRFLPATDVDYDLLHAAMLTLVYSGPLGKKPALLFEAEDDDPDAGRGVGKTKTAQALAHLAGGHIDIRPQDDFEKVLKRLLSPQALDRRVVLLDNVKTLRFSWSDLESLITTDVISGYQNYVGEGTRPNTFNWFITLNNASLSKDMAKRCVIVKLKRPKNDPSWEVGTWKLIDEKRWEIVGDMLAALRARPGTPLQNYARWSEWEEQVLSRVAEPSDCQKVIKERQMEIDGDLEDAELVREAFVVELTRRQHRPDDDAIFIPSEVSAGIINKATQKRLTVPQATGFLNTLAISELKKSKREGKARGHAWRGKNSNPKAVLKMVHDEFGRPQDE
jgi:hypothetical protein